MNSLALPFLGEGEVATWQVLKSPVGVFPQGSPNSVFTPMALRAFSPKRPSHIQAHLYSSSLELSKKYLCLLQTQRYFPEALSTNHYRLDHLKAFTRSEPSLKQKKNPQIKLFSKKRRSLLFWGLDWGSNTKKKVTLVVHPAVLIQTQSWFPAMSSHVCLER